MKYSKNYTGRLVEEPVAKGGVGGQQTPYQPDEVDAVDADDALQGLGVQAWRRPRRVRRVVGCSNSCCSHAAYYRTACPPLRCEDASPIAGAWPPVTGAPRSQGPIDAVT